jgi:hypothetical protein
MMVQDLAVPCAGEANMNLRVTLQNATAAAVADIPSGKELASKAVVEAKGYLVQHNLEMLLSDAMQAVLREKPANPSQFLADRLAGSQNTYPQRAQSAPGGSRSAGAARPDTETLRLQAKQTLLAATQSGALDASLSKLKSSKSAAADDPEVLRQEAKKSLLDASANGDLALALDKLKKPAPSADQEAPTEAATEPVSGEAPVRLRRQKHRPQRLLRRLHQRRSLHQHPYRLQSPPPRWYQEKRQRRLYQRRQKGRRQTPHLQKRRLQRQLRSRHKLWRRLPKLHQQRWHRQRRQRRP